MKNFVITVDGYGTECSRSFNKVIECEDVAGAEKVGEEWIDELIGEYGDEYDEWELVGVAEDSDCKYMVGDSWVDDVEVDEGYY